MSSILSDIRFGIRSLLRSPGMSVIAILCLAIGIGANTAIFSVVHALLLKAMPFHEPDRIITVWQTDINQGDSRNTVSPANFFDWQEQNTVFSSMASYTPVNSNLTGEGLPERVRGARVTAGYFELFGVAPLRGRTFFKADDQDGAEKTVLVSHDFWRDRFNADETLIGNTIMLNDEPHTVIGVMPETFEYPSNCKFWVPQAFSDDEAARRNWTYLTALGRLNPTVTHAQAQSEMSLLAARLRDEYPGEIPNVGIRLIPLRDSLVSNFRPAMLLLMGAVVMVLLIACANVANLLLVRGAERKRELAIRSALGAGRWRIVRQLLTESLVLSLIGGGVGLLLASWGVEFLGSVVIEQMPSLFKTGFGINSTVLFFALALCILTGLVFGVVPSMLASKNDVSSVMKDRDLAHAFSGRLMSMKSLLVMSEIAISFVLLIGAGLITQSFQRLMSNDIGFDGNQVITMATTLPLTKYPEREMQARFYQQSLRRISALPGVESAGAVMTLPFAGDKTVLGYEIQGRPKPGPSETPLTRFDVATPGYFRTLRISLIQGRVFNESDDFDAEAVVVISKNLADEQWPDGNALGQRISTGMKDEDGNDVWCEVVGIVSDIRHAEMGEELQPQMYMPHAQYAWPFMTFVVRSSLEPGLIAQSIRNEVAEIDSDQPLVAYRLLEDVVDETLAVERMTTMLTGGFAGVALFLASIGLFGVMSFGVSQRTHEIGIRMALGAQQKDVLIYFMKQGVILTLIGVAIGLIAAYGLSGLLSSQLYQVTPSDPMTFIVVATVLTVVAMVACYLPARRATKVDPTTALRCE